MEPGALEPRDRLRKEAQEWIARFAPLIDENAPLTDREVRDRLKQLETLKGSAPDLLLLKSSVDEEDLRLVETLKAALRQIPDLDRGLRRRLALYSPGDPQGKVDLDRLRDRLAEIEARRELGMEVVPDAPSRLEFKTSPGNPAGAAFLALFGLGWTAFTTVHAVFMIGGMWRAFGPLAAFLLLFYGLFWAVGISIFVSAFHTAADESIELHGNVLTVRRRFAAFRSEKTYVLDPTKPAREEWTTSTIGSTRNQAHRTKAIVLTDRDGSPISIGMGTTSAHRAEVLRKINAFLAANSQDSSGIS
jgi:uncharacterized membrane protein